MTLKEITKLSPVEVRYVPMPDGGRYYLNTPQYITINENIGKIQQATALLHEIGHALCDIKKCKCFKKSVDEVLREYHAYKFVLKHVKNDKKLMRQFIKDVEYVLNNNCYPDHNKAVQRIIRLKQWTKFCKVVR